MSPPNQQETAAKPGPALSKREARDIEARFISSLRLEPAALCVLGLANCCDKIFHAAPGTRSNKVVRAAIQFLARDRTLQEHIAMIESMTECRCDLKDPFTASLHGSVSDIDPFNFTVLELCFAIMGALDPRPKDAQISNDPGKDLDQVVLRMTDWLELMEDEDQLGPLPSDWDLPPELRAPEPEPEPEAEPDEQHWPGGPEEVFPSSQGVKKTLENLLHWTAVPCGGSGIFLLISRMSDYALSFAEEIPRSPIAIPCALVHLEQALDRFEAKAPPNTFRLAIAAVTHFLHQMPKAYFMLLLTDFRDIFLGVAIRVQPALAQMPGSEAALAKAWWASVRIGLDAGPAFPWDKFGRHKPVTSEVVSSVQLYRMMRIHRAENRCAKPDCQNTAEPRKTMMFCRRCALACYCDTTCQKQGWSKGAAPHKRLCNEVDALRQALGLEKDSAWKEVLTRRAEDIATQPEKIFAELFESKKVDEARSQSIAHLLIQHDAAMPRSSFKYESST
ncbi:MYND-type domain-containing protein [Mycena sanguinolenta]|uniref:MYND-type domain-containing protein n=1 Tax=Mycena sanguinolenta TaxID=230812 RepID=A0A8H6XWS7_9AGAR|nr:MYND-type domain-containing protein [Mycena sanguinolenta]